MMSAIAMARPIRIGSSLKNLAICCPAVSGSGHRVPDLNRRISYAPFSTGTPTSEPYSVHEPS